MSFTKLHELISLAETRNITIGKLMLETEAGQSGRSESDILAQMEQQFEVMEEAVRKGIHEPIKSRSGLTGGDAYQVYEYIKRGNTFVHPETLKTMAYALSVSEVNAGMGRIVATPTAGSAGILPAVLV